MLPCNSKKTGYTSYKTLSHVIKCIFLMCAFLFVNVLTQSDTVEARDNVSYSTQSGFSGSAPSFIYGYRKNTDTLYIDLKVSCDGISKINYINLVVNGTSYKHTYSSKPKTKSVRIYFSNSYSSVTYNADASSGFEYYVPMNGMWTSYSLKADTTWDSERSYSFTISESGAPEISIDADNSGWASLVYKPGVYLKKGTTLTVKIWDRASGVVNGAYMQFSNDDGSGQSPMDKGWIELNRTTGTTFDCANVIYTLKAISDVSLAHFKVRIKGAVDNCGNVMEDVVFDVYIDNVPPTISIGTTSTGMVEGTGKNAVFYAKKSQTFSFSITDNLSVYGNTSDPTYYKFCTVKDTICSDPTWSTIKKSTEDAKSISGTFTTPSSDGIYYLWIYGPRDYAFNQASSQYDIRELGGTYVSGGASYNSRVFKFVIDSVAPTISSFTGSDNDTSNNVTTPATGYTNSKSIKYSISASDASAGIKNYQINDGTTSIYATSTTKPSTGTLANSTEGTHKLTLTIYDKAGNSVTKTTDVVYDVTAPIVSSFNLIGNSTASAGYSNTTNLTFTLSGSDSLSGVYKYQIKEGDSVRTSYTTYATSGNTTLTNTTNGKHTLNVIIADKAGNGSTAKNDDITYDDVDPTISTFYVYGNNGASSGYTNTRSVFYTASATDATSGIIQYSVSGGISNTTSAAPSSVSATLADVEGKQTVTLSVRDNAGNISEDTYDITYDPPSKSPVVSKFEIKGNATASYGYSNITDFTYDIAATDQISGVRNYSIYDDTDDVYLTREVTTKPTSGKLGTTNQGTHSIYLIVTDYAGNEGRLLFLMTYDTTAPTISKFNVIGGSGNWGTPNAGYTATTNVTFDIESDFETTAQREFYVYDGSTVIATSIAESIGTPPSVPTSGTLATATEGTHTLKLKIVDFAGNIVESKLFNIILDTTNPVITTFTYEGNEEAMEGYTNQQSISYSLTATETNFSSSTISLSNPSGTSCSSNSKTLTSKSTSGTFSLCDTTNGEHSIIVMVFDKAGRYTMFVYTIIMDTVAPVLSLSTSLSPSLPAKSGTATITYTEKYPRVTMAGETLRYVLSTVADDTADITCTVVTSTTLTQTNCFASSALTNTSTDVYSITLTLSPTTSGTYYLRVVDENLAMDRAGNTATSPVSKVNMIVNEETVSTYVFGGYLIDQTAPTVSLSLGNGSYNGSGTSTIHYSKTGASITVKFTDNMYLYNYSDNSYYRYCWSTTTSCSSYTAISGTRTKTEVSGSVTVPSTIGTHYLILEGNARDYAGWYPTNSYLYTSRTKTASGTRIFKFVTDNTAGSLTIGHTKVDDTYYAKPGITASVNYTDNTALRTYNTANNHAYAWSKSATAISGWSDTYLNSMPSRTLTNIGGITTPTTEGTWYLMLYSQSRDAAGNTISTPTAYGTASVKYKGWLWDYTYTAKVYKFIIDGTKPEFVIEHDEDTYYAKHKDASITELKVGDTVKLGYEEAHGRATGTYSNGIYYYLSTELEYGFMSGIEAAHASQDRTLEFGEEFTIMEYMSGYYMYFFIKSGSTEYSRYATDYAGNMLNYDYYSGGYYLVIFYIEPIMERVDEEYKTPVEEVLSNNGVVGDNLVKVDDEGNIQQIQDKKYLLVTINQNLNGITFGKVAEILNLELLSVDMNDAITGSLPMIDCVVKSPESNKYSLVSIVIFYNAPQAIINESNNAPVVVNQGEEIANVGMSFTSKDGSEVSVDTLITLDGVKVKSVDTNVPGVYSVTQVAKDRLGRTTKVNKNIVVLANEEVKEEILKEEVIEVVEEVVALPVEVKVNNEKVEEVKVVEVEVNRVEVKLENKVKVNGYKKRKEIRKNKKEQFSFKLFSKYFFKVYDG